MRRGERHDECVQLFEREDAGTVGGHAGPRGAKLALDLMDQVTRKRLARLSERAGGGLSVR
jgi:hypothetical protein